MCLPPGSFVRLAIVRARDENKEILIEFRDPPQLMLEPEEHIIRLCRDRGALIRLVGENEVAGRQPIGGQIPVGLDREAGCKRVPVKDGDVGTRRRNTLPPPRKELLAVVVGGCLNVLTSWTDHTTNVRIHRTEP